MLFYLAVYVLQHWTASASSYMVVLVPFVTVPLAALLAEEEITVWLTHLRRNWRRHPRYLGDHRAAAQ